MLTAHRRRPAPWHWSVADDERTARPRDRAAGALRPRAGRDAGRRGGPARSAATEAGPRPPEEADRAQGIVGSSDDESGLSRREYEALLEPPAGAARRLAWKAYDAKRRSTVAGVRGLGRRGQGRRHPAPDRGDRRPALPGIPIAAPTDEERAHHYLWRFWRHLPRAGRITIFDRSWYGRVLVERVEGFARRDEWRRAYAEINEFEEQLAEHGMVARASSGCTSPRRSSSAASRSASDAAYKQLEDHRRGLAQPREVDATTRRRSTRCSSAPAPARALDLVEANDKRYARIDALQTVCVTLERALAKG